MSQTYKNFEKGVGLVPNNSDQNQVKGDLNVLSSDGKIAYHNGTSSSPIVTEVHASQGNNRLKNKDLEDSTTSIVDITDTTIKIKFNAAGSTNTTTNIISSQTSNRTITLPDATDTLVARNTQDTLTNKTLTLPIMSQITSGSYTLTLPNSNSDTLVGKATSDTFTNKTYDTAAIGNIFKINGTQITNVTGTGSVVLDSSPTINSAQINYPILFDPTTNKVSSYNLQDLQYYTQSSGNWHRFYCGTTEISRILNTGLEIQPNKNITFSTLTNSISITAPTINNNYTIALPEASPFQNTSLFYNKAGSYVWEPVLNNNKSLQTVTAVIASTTPSVYGCAIPTVVKDVGSNGAAVAVTPSFTSYYTSRKLLEYQTVSGSSSIAGWRWGSVKPIIIGTSSYGGFKFSTGFGFQSGFSVPTGRTFFVGVVSSSSDPGISNPSSSSNIVGFGLDNTDSNIQFMYRGSGSINKIDLGASFPRPTSDKTTFYAIELSAYNGSVSYKIKEMVSGAIATGTVSSNLPSASLQLSPICYVSAGSGASIATGIGMEYITIES